jgi:hypothetical protein
MLYQHFSLGHAQYIWNLRQNEKVVNVFSSLYGVDDLLTSFDGLSFLPPMGKFHKEDWLHCDQSFKRNDFECIQSWVTGYDVEMGDATLVVLEKSHLLHSLFRQKFSVDDPKDWYKLNSEQVDWYIKNGCKRRSILCKAGDMVLWDSRTIHAGQNPIREKNSDTYRHVVYICMTPLYLSSDKNLEKKRDAFEKMRMTTHWPHKQKLFHPSPRTYGNDIEEITQLPKPILTEVGMKLAGFIN